MRLLTILMTVSAVSLFAVAPVAAVQFNEIRIDQPGSDNDEYIELIGTPGESLDGLSIVTIGDGATGSGTVDSNGVVDLTGFSIPADGIFLITESTHTNVADADLVTTLGLENSDNLSHFLVSGNTAVAGDDLDTDDDCTLDIIPWTAVVDEVAMIEEANPPASTECHYGGTLVGPDGTFVPGHIYRCGNDWLIGGFAFPTDDTPGTANTNCPVQTTNDSWGSVKSRF